MPNPPAEFSPLRMVRWGSTSFLSPGRMALTASRPGEPTTSATNRIRKSSATSPKGYRLDDPEGAGRSVIPPRRSARPVHCDDLEWPGDSLDLQLSWLRHRKTRRHSRSARHDLVRTRQRRNAGGLVHPASPILLTGQPCAGGVHPDTHPGRETMFAALGRQPALNGNRTLQRRRRVRERDEESIAGMIHLLASVALETLPQCTVEPCEQLRPGLIADRLDQLGRSDHVAEKQSPLCDRGSRRWDAGARQPALRLN